LIEAVSGNAVRQRAAEHLNGVLSEEERIDDTFQTGTAALSENPAVAHTHLLGRPFLRQLSIPDAFQPIQPVSFLLAHRDPFHLHSLQAVKRNFLLCPNRSWR
jgi:hypothetical protein